MSRWTETFAALSRSHDTVDTVRHSGGPANTVSQSVKSVTALACKPATQPEEPDGWTDAHDERAAVIGYDGGAPRAWAEALARLDPRKSPADVPMKRWLRFIDDCGRFLDEGGAEQAAALGWGPLDLFGCDRKRPFARIDRLGLLWLLNGGTVVELHRERAVLETETGARQSYRRRPVEVGRTVLAWELANSTR